MAGRWTLLWVAAGAAAALRPECPVQLLSVTEENDGFQLLEGGLSYLQQQRSPLYLVPVLGVYRGGKSFLLNRCMGLQAPYAGGFGVGHMQDTHTRGIYVCAEDVEGLGTVVWMDTEGLFSAEYAQSSYSPKMFSLAMLFSSTVLLNSVKVLNDQFFSFFSEQQQLARVLRHGLQAEGLPEGALLPRNHSLIWVLQQPVSLEGNADVQLQHQLDAFLEVAGDEARERVHRDFNHHLMMVPAASRDVRIWGTLDKTPEAELLPGFVDATSKLKGLVLHLLRSARPMEADGVAQQMRMFAQLVETQQFNGKLARAAVEEAELSKHCGEFGRTLATLAQQLPMPGLGALTQRAWLQAEANASEAAENFHFTQSWKTRLGVCLDSRASDIAQRNEQRLLELWQSKANLLAERAGCFFLDELMSLRDEMDKAHDCILGNDLRDRSVKFAIALQRTRLVECVKLKHLFMPVLPWIVWPIISFYIGSGLFSGLWQLAVHSFLAAGAYALLRMLKQIPSYLDTEYPVLQARPQLLDAVMMVVPWMPWASLINIFGVIGLVWSSVKLLRVLADRCRPSGDQIGGMVNLEMKLNVLLKRSEVLLQQGLLATLHETTAHVSRRDAPSAKLSLMRGLCMLRGSGGGEDPQISAMADYQMRHRIIRLLEECAGLETSRDFCEAWTARDILGSAMRGDWTDAVGMMVEVLEGCKGPSSFVGSKRCTRAASPAPGFRRRDIMGGS